MNSLRALLAGTTLLAACSAGSSDRPTTATVAAGDEPAVATTAEVPEIATPVTLVPPTLSVAVLAELGASVDAAPDPQTDPTAKIVLDNKVLHFAVGSSVLAASADEVLQPIVDFVAWHTSRGRSLIVTSIGHTSPEGATEEGHMVLSCARSASVARRLLDLGLTTTPIRVVGLGASQPARTGPHPLEDDRRVVITIDETPRQAPAPECPRA